MMDGLSNSKSYLTKRKGSPMRWILLSLALSGCRNCVIHEVEVRHLHSVVPVTTVSSKLTVKPPPIIILVKESPCPACVPSI
jgi:hypothetical protein